MDLDLDLFSDDSSDTSFPCNSSSLEPPEGLLQRMDSFSDSSRDASYPDEDETDTDEVTSDVELVGSGGAISIRVRHNLRLRGRRNVSDEQIAHQTISNENSTNDSHDDVSGSDSDDGGGSADVSDNSESAGQPDLMSDDDDSGSAGQPDLMSDDESALSTIHSPGDEFSPDDQFNIISDDEIGIDHVNVISDDDIAPHHSINIISDEEIGIGEEASNVISDDEIALHDNVEQVPGTSSLTSARDTLKSPVITKIRKRARGLDDTMDDGQSCSICFEPWSNSGEHRIASLKCGHLFGKHCIERWLKGSRSRCPQCNTASSKRDIRVLYAKSIRVLDTTEKDRLAQELTKVKTEKLSLERKHATATMNNVINTQLVGKLQDELRMLKESVRDGKSAVQTIDISGSTQPVHRLALCKSFDLSHGCRVMCYNEWLNMLIVSVISRAGIFPGCGVKKINLFDLRVDKYVPIHLKQIRDLSFNQMNHEILLSVGMDQRVKITNISNGATLHQYKMAAAVFSCCWKSLSATEFFVGTSPGKVLHFNTVWTDPVDTVTVSGAGPVVTLCHIPSLEGMAIEGLLVVRLDSICLLELSHDKKKEHRLSVEGPFTGLHYDPDSKYFLINCRPSQRNPHARHILCRLVAMETEGGAFVELREVHTFLGSSTMKLLSRSSIVVSMRGKTWVVVNEESTLCAKIYDASNPPVFELVQRMNFSANVVECLSARIHNDFYIVFLTEKKAHLYKLIEH